MPKIDMTTVVIAGVVALVVIYLNNKDMLPEFFKPEVKEPGAPAAKA